MHQYKSARRNQMLLRCFARSFGPRSCLIRCFAVRPSERSTVRGSTNTRYCALTRCGRQYSRQHCVRWLTPTSAKRLILTAALCVCGIQELAKEVRVLIDCQRQAAQRMTEVSEGGEEGGKEGGGRRREERGAREEGKEGARQWEERRTGGRERGEREREVGKKES
eukprot:286452-Rhodomonas_salina.1